MWIWEWSGAFAGKRLAAQSGTDSRCDVVLCLISAPDSPASPVEFQTNRSSKLSSAEAL